MQLQETPVIQPAVMPRLTAVVDSVEARWRAWQARGAASDGRSGRIMLVLFAVALTLLVAWLVARGVSLMPGGFTAPA
jgi:hypothetical protein